MLRMAAIGDVHVKEPKVVLNFTEWNLKPTPKYQLQKVWVQVLGVPFEVHDFLSLCAIGSIIGLALRVDMEKVRKNDLVRMLVGVLDVDAIPSSVEIVVGESVYDVFFIVEDTMMNSVDEANNQTKDHEGEDKSGKGKDVVMEDRDAKRPKNTSAASSSVPENRKGQNTSDAKGASLGLSILDTIWVTPRAVRKDCDTVAGDGVQVGLISQGETVVGDLAGSSSMQLTKVGVESYVVMGNEALAYGGESLLMTADRKLVPMSDPAQVYSVDLSVEAAERSLFSALEDSVDATLQFSVDPALVNSVDSVEIAAQVGLLVAETGESIPTVGDLASNNSVGVDNTATFDSLVAGSGCYGALICEEVQRESAATVANGKEVKESTQEQALEEAEMLGGVMQEAMVAASPQMANNSLDFVLGAADYMDSMARQGTRQGRSEEENFDKSIKHPHDGQIEECLAKHFGCDKAHSVGQQEVFSSLDSGLGKNSKVGFSGPSTFGVIRSPLIRKEDTVEPQQSESIKKQQSGDGDLVQKAIRWAKVRNLEVDSSNPSTG